MEERQVFRVPGSTQVVNIDVDNFDGQNVIFWRDIEQAFPGVQYVRNGESMIKFLMAPDKQRIEPLCIKYYPGVDLDVVLSTATECVRTDAPIVPPSPVLADAPIISQNDASIDSLDGDKVIEALQVTSPDADIPIGNIHISPVSTIPQLLPLNSSSRVQAAPKITLSFRQIVNLASKKAQESNSQVGLYDGLGKDIKEMKTELLKISELTAQNAEQASRMVELQEALNAKQDEIKQLQVQALNQLAVIQNRVQAVLTQTYELHEYPIPRLFVVLPQDSSSWDILDPFTK
ncbi:hypothetical protein BGX27_001650, partial [Mortierella sp. AM989]